MVPRLPAVTTDILFFLLNEKEVLSSFRRTGKDCRVEIAFINYNISCLSMILRQGTCKKEKVPATTTVVASRCFPENQ